MRVESLELENYRVFRKAKFADLPRMPVVVGANGSGKSTLFDVFSFLQEALAHNVAGAVVRRGGFRELISRGHEDEAIGITVKFRETGGRLATYELKIAEADGRPMVDQEALRYRRGRSGRPSKFIDFRQGRGEAITNEVALGEDDAEEKRGTFQLDDPSALALKGLGQFRQFRTASEFRKLLESWRVSNPRADGAYSGVGTGCGSARLAPLYDQAPHSLLAIEGPEHRLYPSLLAELVEEFRGYADRGGQIFVSTHSPGFLNGAEPAEVYWLVKERGFSAVRRASDSAALRNLCAEGDALGALWRRGLLEGAHPQ